MLPIMALLSMNLKTITRQQTLWFAPETVWARDRNAAQVELKLVTCVWRVKTCPKHKEFAISRPINTLYWNSTQNTAQSFVWELANLNPQEIRGSISQTDKIKRCHIKILMSLFSSPFLSFYWQNEKSFFLIFFFAASAMITKFGCSFNRTCVCEFETVCGRQVKLGGNVRPGFILRTCKSI